MTALTRIEFSDALEFGAVRPGDQVPIRVGSSYWLVSAVVASALWHLHLMPRPVDRQESQRRLREVLPEVAAEKLNERLWQSLTSSDADEKSGRRKIFRISISKAGNARARRAARFLSATPARAGWWLLIAAALAASIFPPARSVPRPAEPSIAAGVIGLLSQLLIICIHESGHLLAAARHRVRVREVGAKLHGGGLAAYVDVRDSWLASRRARIEIAGGGVAFHLVPTLVLWIVWRRIGIETAFWLAAGNAALILVNVLPALRLDGYWMLANAVEEPNLERRAFTELFRGRSGGASSGLTEARAKRIRSYAFFAIAVRPALAFGAAAIVHWALPQAPVALIWTMAAILAVFAGVRTVRTAVRGVGEQGKPEIKSPAGPDAPRANDRPPEGDRIALASRSQDFAVNPFRFRGTLEGSTILGSFEEIRRAPPDSPLAMLSRARRIRPSEMDRFDPATRAGLLDDRFLVASAPELEGRWSRQLGFFSLLVADPGASQNRLAESTVCVLGVGTLGSQVAYLLAAAGIGGLRLCDYDVVEPSNLNRQILYSERDVGKPKVLAASARLRRINSRVAVSAIEERLGCADDVESAIGEASLVVRAVDTPYRIGFAIDAACRARGIPHVGGGLLEHFASAGPFVSPDGLCLRCLSGEGEIAPALFRAAATFGPWTFWAAGHVAADVIFSLTGLGEPLLQNRVRVLNGRTGESELHELGKGAPGCVSCRPR